ncbi:MAG TPA: hypothetical protein VGB97_01085 [Candidatus Paceibacterota bacterium]|jgi:hypothetical protein
MKVVKLSIIVQTTHEATVREALGSAGVGKIGNYRNCQFMTHGKAQFYATEDADPTLGEAGGLTITDAVQIQTWCEEGQVDAVIKAVKDAHPNEEPAIEVHPFELR